jgi:hypothetical protein
MNNTHQPPDGEPQDFWATQEIRPETGQPGQAGPASAPWQQPGWGEPAGPPGPPGPHAQHGPHAPHAPHAQYGPHAQHGQYDQHAQHAQHGQYGPHAQYGGPQPPRRSRALWWGAGLALVAVLAGGGAFAATQLASNTSPAAATTGAAGPTGQAAQLNALLNSASSPSSEAAAATFGTTSSGPTAAASRPCTTRAAKLKAAGHPVAARHALRLCRHALARVRLLGGLHGQFTFKTKNGYKTLAYERGVIRSISGSDVTVQATDGTTWTWVLVSSTVVRHGGQKVASSELAEGQQVFAGGPVVSGVYDARLIVIRPAGSTSPTPSSSSSPATGS